MNSPFSHRASLVHTVTPRRVIVALLALLAAAVTGAPRTMHAQTTTLVGTVLADGTERPVVGAEVVVHGLELTARTDSAGRFTIGGVTRGEHLIAIRALGFAPLASRIAFTGSERVEIDFLLETGVQTLEKVEVKAAEADAERIAFRISGFSERQKMGFGRFVTQEMFEKAEGRSVANVLIGRIPGLKVAIDPKNGRRFMSSIRVVTKRECPVTVMLDGITHPGPEPFQIDTIDPSTVGGIEFYTPASAPMRFNVGSCGTLVIWLKG